MTWYAVIGQSPFSDVSVGAGPSQSLTATRLADEDMTAKGWNTEVVELGPTRAVPTVVNDEGAETDD